MVIFIESMEFVLCKVDYPFFQPRFYLKRVQQHTVSIYREGRCTNRFIANVTSNVVN